MDEDVFGDIKILEPGPLKKKTSSEKRFFFHYNKPESRKQSRNVLTVHWQDRCIPVNSIKCSVPVETHHRKTQPHCIMRGWAQHVTITRESGNTLALIG